MSKEICQKKLTKLRQIRQEKFIDKIRQNFNIIQNSKIISFAFSGPRLKGVTLDAFEGIDSYELLLAIRDSSLEELPMHFYTVIY